MKLANLAGRAHLVDGTRAIDVHEASGGRFDPDPMSLFDRWHEVLVWSPDADWATASTFDQTRALAPVPRPRQVFAVASNYHGRPTVLESSPDLPVVFTKFPDSITSPYADLPLPTETVDWEIELVVVVGRGGRDIPETTAWDHVAGVTIGQDFSERTMQLGGPAKQFCLGKSFPAFGPIGPLLATPDEFADPDDIPLRCSIDGEVVQDASTALMIFPISTLVARLSSTVTLHPGDLIFTGTPAGTGMTMRPPRYLRAGEVVVSAIPGIGEMRNRCSTWS